MAKPAPFWRLSGARGGARETADARTSGLRNGPAKVYFRPSDITLGADGTGEIEGRVESLRRTPAGVRATIAIDGFNQILEIDSSVDHAAALGERVPISIAKARVFPLEKQELPRLARGA